MTPPQKYVVKEQTRGCNPTSTYMRPKSCMNLRFGYDQRPKFWQHNISKGRRRLIPCANVSIAPGLNVAVSR